MIITICKRAFWALMFLPALAGADSPFDGTWRPDPQKPNPTDLPDSVSLRSGIYECQSCKPPYTVKADAQDQPVTGNPLYDTVSIAVTDDRTLIKRAKKGGKTVFESKVVVSTDGATLTEWQTLFGMSPRPVEITRKSSRLSKRAPGAHLISGQWQPIETDLTHHDEDTTFKIDDGTLTMSDRMGRSFRAKLDGTDAPYRGDSEFTAVSVRTIDPRTIEESDKTAGKVVKISRWTVDPDGKTMHARFDDTHGHIQQQTGHKLP
jgi:hypothetical protein